ncbi:MAG: glycosyltransferase family 4 protein [Anaerolineae bacterium]
MRERTDMPHIAMLLSNGFRPDPRVAHEAKALVEAGCEVTVLCWDREDEFPANEAVDGYRIDRVQSIPTGYGAGPRQLTRTPLFWREAVRRVLDLGADVVHCHDLDTLPAGWWLKRRLGVPLVYDAHEDYPALMSLYLPNPMVSMLSWLEQRLLRKVDYTITASSVFADKLRNQGVDPVVTIGNYQPLAPFDVISPDEVEAARSRLGLNADDFAAAYIGGFSRNRQILPLIKAGRHLPTVRILIWGDGYQRDQVEAAVRETQNASYRGWLPAEQVPLYTRAVDAIYYCLLSDYPGAVYNAPNTLSNAMAAGRPIIANDVGDLGRIIRETGCGILVPEPSPDAIRVAIELLQDRAVRERMGEAGRRAAEMRYNWNTVAEQLYRVYEELGAGTPP